MVRGDAKKAEGRVAQPTPQERQKVLKLRNDGKTFKEIDEAMGWGNHGGMKSWRLINNPNAYQPGPRRRRPSQPTQPRVMLPEGVQPEPPRVHQGPAWSRPLGTPPEGRQGYGRRIEDQIQGQLADAVRAIVAQYLTSMFPMFQPVPMQATTQAQAPMAMADRKEE